MKIRIGINGFGRIGRAVFRLSHEKFKDVEIVGINDLGSTSSLLYLIKYDSIHGRFSKSVKAIENGWVIEGKRTRILNEKDPSNLPWKELKADYIIESTGRFNRSEEAQKTSACGG